MQLILFLSYIAYTFTEDLNHFFSQYSYISYQFQILFSKISMNFMVWISYSYYSWIFLPYQLKQFFFLKKWNPILEADNEERLSPLPKTWSDKINRFAKSFVTIVLQQRKKPSRGHPTERHTISYAKNGILKLDWKTCLF